MHSSITTHIIDNFYDDTSGTWGPNMKMFKWRFANPEARPYVENLYFAYLFVLRAVIKAAPVLEGFDFNTGMKQEDVRTQHLVKQLVCWKVDWGGDGGGCLCMSCVCMMMLAVVY